MSSQPARRLFVLGILCLALLGTSCEQVSGLLPPTPTAATPLVYLSPTPTAPRLTPTRTPLLTPSPAATVPPGTVAVPTRPSVATVVPVRPLLPTPILVPLSPVPTRSPTPG